MKEHFLKNVRIYVSLASMLACTVVLVCGNAKAAVAYLLLSICAFMWQYEYDSANRMIELLDKRIKDAEKEQEPLKAAVANFRSAFLAERNNREHLEQVLKDIDAQAPKGSEQPTPTAEQPKEQPNGKGYRRKDKRGYSLDTKHIFVDVKKCKRCGSVLPIGMFYKDNSKKDGHRSLCRKCVNEIRMNKKQQLKQQHHDGGTV